MKYISFFTLLFLLHFQLSAQDSPTDSYTIQRLIIYNQKGEILLEKHANGWMTPAIRHNSKESTNGALAKLASEFGLKISAPRLAGIFMFISEYKPQSSFRQHYISQLIDGDLITPEGKSDVKWFAPHIAIEMMGLPETKLVFAVRDMTKQVIDYPHIIWGGSFTLWKENGQTKYRVSENFYSIGRVE